MSGRRYALYGDADSREGRAFALALAAKGLAFERVAATPVLAFALASRAGREAEAYLRTPEGCLFGDVHAALDHLERAHPSPAWRPTTPVRRVCARLLEDWLELWLPLWPERTRAMLERIGNHLARSPFLLGAAPTRPDGSLAAWLEGEALRDPLLRLELAERAPRLADFAERVRRTLVAGIDARAAAPTAGDDAIPLSLIPILQALAQDFLVYLDANREALWDGHAGVEVELDSGPGRIAMPAWRRFELRRAEIAEELARLAPVERRAVRQMLEPLGAWSVLTLPAVIEPPSLADPRAL